MAKNTHHVQLNGGVRRGVFLKPEATIENENKGKLETYSCSSIAGHPARPRNFHPILQNGEIKSSKTSDRQNTYIIARIPPQPVASGNKILERIQLFETLNRKENYEPDN